MICPSCSAENVDSADTCFQCGKGLYAVTHGSLLAGRYEIQDTLGRGGMGMVYKAHDTVLDETVAIKVLRADFAGSPDLERRLRSEIKLARRIRQRNVCGIHEYGQAGHLSFIVMELISGVDLRKVLAERGAMVPDDAFDVAIQLCEGLQAIHDAGVVHRDLKTPNIMRDPTGVVRLMDFGIAKDYGSDSASSATSTGQILGTPEYMSPEQAQGQRIDGRSDIYALGIVVFELFTGRVPFRGDTPLATIFKHLKEPPPLDLPEFALPAALRPVLGKALAKAPEDRFQSATEMRDALIAARDGSPMQVAPTQALPPTLTDPAEASTRALDGPTRPVADAAVTATGPAARLPTRRLPIAWIAAGAAVVIAGLGVLWTAGGRAPDVPIATPASPEPGTEPDPDVDADAPLVADLPTEPTPPDARPPAPTPVPEREAPRAAPSPAPATSGRLHVTAAPDTEVTVNGQPVGRTPFPPMELETGTHTVILQHPDYEAIVRRVSVRAGTTTEVSVDLAAEGTPLRSVVAAADVEPAPTPPPSTQPPTPAPVSNAPPIVFKKVDYFLNEGDDAKDFDARLVLYPGRREIVISDEDHGEDKETFARIPYDRITELAYERSAHRRWKTAVLVSPLALFTKGKKHWLTIAFEGVPSLPQNYVYVRLDKNNYRQILQALQAQTGIEPSVTTEE